MESFTHMMSKDVQKWSGQIHDKHWQLQKLSDRVKLFSDSYEFHFRFDLNEWNTIRRQFVSELRKKNLA